MTLSSRNQPVSIVIAGNSISAKDGGTEAETGDDAKKIGYHRQDVKKKRVRNTVIVVSVILAIGLALAALIPPSAIGNQLGASQQANSLQPVTNDAGGVSFEITPQGYSPNEPIVFNVAINTHQGSLDYDFTKISTLETSSGGKYTPSKWDGASGGHHLSGTLTFPSVGQTSLLRLTILGVYGVPERVFEWNLGSLTGGSGSTSTSSVSLDSLNLPILGGAIIAALLAAFLLNIRRTTTTTSSANKENHDKSTEREEETKSGKESSSSSAHGEESGR